jgi:hypothetical protein
MNLHFSFSFWAILFFGAYAVLGFVSMIRALRADILMPRKLRWEKTTIYVACMMQTIFEVVRSIWDCFHGQHFPLIYSDPFLIGIFSVLGYASFKVFDLRGWSLYLGADDSK